MKGYSTLIPIKYNNSDPRNKGFHKTQDSHKKLSSFQLHNESGSRSESILMENSHKPSMINPINNAQIAEHAQWSRISSTNISLCLLFFTHTLVINKLYYDEKLQEVNKLSQITYENMKPHPMRQPLELKYSNQCQMME